MLCTCSTSPGEGAVCLCRSVTGGATGNESLTDRFQLAAVWVNREGNIIKEDTHLNTLIPSTVLNITSASVEWNQCCGLLNIFLVKLQQLGPFSCFARNRFATGTSSCSPSLVTDVNIPLYISEWYKTLWINCVDSRLNDEHSKCLSFCFLLLLILNGYFLPLGRKCHQITAPVPMAACVCVCVCIFTSRFLWSSMITALLSLSTSSAML